MSTPMTPSRRDLTERRVEAIALRLRAKFGNQNQSIQFWEIDALEVIAADPATSELEQLNSHGVGKVLAENLRLTALLERAAEVLEAARKRAEWHADGDIDEIDDPDPFDDPDGCLLKRIEALLAELRAMGKGAGGP